MVGKVPSIKNQIVNIHTADSLQLVYQLYYRYRACIYGHEVSVIDLDLLS